MNPCALDGTDQRARTVLAACVEPDGPVDADGDQALVIDDVHHPTFLPGARRHGRGTRPPGRECDGRDSAGCSWPRLARISLVPSTRSWYSCGEEGTDGCVLLGFTDAGIQGQ